VQALVEGDRARGLAVRIEVSRIGLEGETKLCAEYEDPRAAEQAFERARALVKGVELVNLAREPCPKGPGKEES
jgi:hypothetical protein